MNHPRTASLDRREAPENRLKRSLGLGSLTFYGIGLILGAGIYTILGEAAGVAGEAVWMAFVLGSLAALLTGLSYSELATMYPEAGAEYVYARHAWPRLTWLPGTLGWVLIGSGVATAATVALAFAGYASLFVAIPSWMVAVAVVVVVVALNVIGVKESSWANVLFTLIEAGGLVAVIAVGMQSPEFGSVFLTTPTVGVLSGAGLIFFAYLGFEDIVNLAEEAREPARDIPRSILIAVGVCTTLYVLVAVACVSLLDPQSLAASGSPLVDAIRERAPKLAGALGGVALFATANTALIAITAASRLLFSMGRGGDAPAAFYKLLPGRRTPVYAILFAGAVTLVFLPLGRVGLVGSVASLLALIAFASVNAAVLFLRIRQAGAERPFRVPLTLGRVPIPSVLGLLVVLLLLTQLEGKAYLVAAAALAIAFVIQAIPWKRSKVAEQQERH